MKLRFYKYEGAGNDFILVDNRERAFEAERELVSHLCDRHFGIGADGLMLLENDAKTEFRMRYFNSDGGESTMCGNGGRCIALFAEHLGIGDYEKTFIAPDGLHIARILQQSLNSALIALGMSDVTNIYHVLDGLFVDSGSPHYVQFVEDVDNVDVFERGRELRNDKEFERYGGVNVNFVSYAPDNSLRVRTYERGVEDETLACGTGITASAVAANYLHEEYKKKYDVKAPGGELRVEFDRNQNGVYTNIILTGEARRVFAGELENFM